MNTRHDAQGGAGRSIATLRVVVPWLVLLTAIGLAVASVAGQSAGLVAALHQLGWPRVLAATGCSVAGVAITAEVWRNCVAATTGRDLPRGLTHRVFWVSQAGKYVPGAVWPFLVQALAARRLHAGTRQVLTGGAVFLGVHALTAVLLGAAGLSVLPGTAPLVRWGAWTLAGAGLLVLVTGVWRQVPRVIGRAPLPRLQAAATARAVAWMCAAWLAYGIGTTLLVAPLAHSGGLLLLLSTAAAAIGWLVGLLVVIAPAGAGAREVAMAWVLGPLLNAQDVLTVVLLTRLALLIGDLGLALTGVGVLRELRASRDDRPGRTGRDADWDDQASLDRPAPVRPTGPPEPPRASARPRR